MLTGMFTKVFKICTINHSGFEVPIPKNTTSRGIHPIPQPKTLNAMLKYPLLQKTRTHIIQWLFLYIGILMISCSSDNSSSRQGPRATSAEGYRIETESHTITIRSTGELMPYESVELRTPVAGNVHRIHFNEGEYVREGALLVEIDSRTWQAQKKGLEAQLVSAQSELERRNRLLEIEGASQESVDQAFATVSDLEARIEELHVRIDLANIRAPFSGRLGMRDFSPGAYLSQGEIITRLVQTRQLKINFDIPARYAAIAQKGMEVMVISSSSSDSILARVYAMEPFINANTRNLRLRGILDNEEQKFIPGDFIRVIIDAEQNENAILIPTESIISELNAQVVYLVREGKAQRREVEIGTSTRGRVMILDGLQEGDTIMLTGLMGIRDGSDVQIRNLNQEAGR